MSLLDKIRSSRRWISSAVMPIALGIGLDYMVSRIAKNDLALGQDSEDAFILFGSYRDEGCRVYGVKANKYSYTHKLTDDIWNVISLDWPSVEDKLVFASDMEKNPEKTEVILFANLDIYLADLNMNTREIIIRNLTNNLGVDTTPSWSPDRSKIVFASERDGNMEIYVMNADGSNPRNLTRHPALDIAPSWSPDGSKIAFTSNRDGNLEIYVMNADGSKPRNLTKHPRNDESPSWSPDGTKIAFASDRDSDTKFFGLYYVENFDIFVADIDGSNPRNLTRENRSGDNNPKWSPDGSKIAFASQKYTQNRKNYEICIMEPDGSNLINLTDDTAHDFSPTWLIPNRSSSDNRPIKIISSDNPIIVSFDDNYTVGAYNDSGKKLLDFDIVVSNPKAANAMSHIKEAGLYIGSIANTQPQLARIYYKDSESDEFKPVIDESQNSALTEVAYETYKVFVSPVGTVEEIITGMQKFFDYLNSTRPDIVKPRFIGIDENSASFYFSEDQADLGAIALPGFSKEVRHVRFEIPYGGEGIPDFFLKYNVGQFNPIPARVAVYGFEKHGDDSPIITKQAENVLVYSSLDNRVQAEFHLQPDSKK